MSRNLKIVVGAVAAVVLLLAILPALVDADQFRPLLEREATRALGRQVTIGKLSLSIFKGEVGADEIAIAEDPAFDRDAFIRAAGFRAGVEIMPLISSKKLIIGSVELVEPQVTLIQAPDMRWNFSSLGGKEKASEPAKGDAEGGGFEASIKNLRLVNGKLTLKQPGAGPEGIVIDKVDLEARDLSATTQMPVKVSGEVGGGGKIALEGTAGPLAQGNTPLTPVEARVQAEKVDLAQAGFATVGGLADYAGSLTSSNGVARLNGKLTINGLKVGAKAQPAGRAIELTYNLTHDLRAHSGKLEQTAVKAGGATAQLGGQYSASGSQTNIGLALNGSGMSVDELVALLPAFGVVLPAGATLKGGSMSITAKTQGAAPNVASTGTVTLSNSQLAGFSLGGAVSKAASLAGIQVGPDTVIERFQSDFENNPQATRLSGIQLVVAGLGSMTGALTIDAAQNLNGQLDARIIRGGDKELMLPLTIGGTASNPKIGADARALAGQAAKSAVEKYVPGEAGKAASGILGGILGGKKKR